MERTGSKVASGAAACVLLLGLSFGPASASSATAATTNTRSDPPRPVSSGLRFETHATFTLDEAAKVVHVRDDMTVTNTQPAVYNGYYYLPRLAVPVGSEATNPAAARDDGTPLSVEIEGTDLSWLSIAKIDLAPVLVSGDTQTISFTFDLPGQPARSPGFTRVNDAEATFEVYALGDPDITSVKVIVPKDLKVEIGREAMTRVEQPDGTILYSADPIADPEFWDAGVVVTDPTKLLSADPLLPGHDIAVRGWPGDQPWVDFTSTQITSGLPVLESLIGRPWPTRTDPLQVIESASPGQYGYAGWYSVSDNEIDVDEKLDPVTILHELSHVWFNRDLFSDRWVDEGLAQEYSNLAVGQLTGAVPAVPDPIDGTDPAAHALDDWSAPGFTSDTADAREHYDYVASWYVIHGIVSEVGPAKMVSVFAAAADHEIPYVGAGAPEQVGSGGVTWRTLLDLLDERAASPSANPLFAAYVAAGDDRARLATRATARQQYAAFVAASGGWSAPYPVRKAMSDWDFDRAALAETKSSAVLAVRDQIAATLAPVGLQVPAALQHSYESGTDLDAIEAEADADLQGAKDLAAAAAERHGSHGPLAQVGLLGGGADRVYASAKAAMVRGDGAAASRTARRASGLDHDATRDGIVRLFALLLLVAVALSLRRARAGPLRPV